MKTIYNWIWELRHGFKLLTAPFSFMIVTEPFGALLHVALTGQPVGPEWFTVWFVCWVPVIAMIASEQYLHYRAFGYWMLTWQEHYTETYLVRPMYLGDDLTYRNKLKELRLERERKARERERERGVLSVLNLAPAASPNGALNLGFAT